MRTHGSKEQAVLDRTLVIAGVVAMLGMTLALTGCAVGPRFVKPAVALSENWNEKSDSLFATQAIPDSAWWHAFNDATLDSLVELAYHQNLPLQIAGLRILEARAQLGVAVGRQYPQIQAITGNVSNVGLSAHAPNGFGTDRQFWNYQLGFDALWEPDFWGKYREDVRAEAATYLSTVAAYDDALVSLTAEVARTYAVIRTLEMLVEQARQNITLQEEGLRIADARFHNGATSELDVSQARTLLESTRTTVPQLEASLQQADNALCTLLGQPTGTIEKRLAGSSGIPTAPASVAISVPAELLRRRPDIRGVELNAIAQCARIGIAKAELYPSFSLFGSIGSQTSSNGGPQSGGATFKNFFDPTSFFYSFGTGIFWQIFNYGRTKNNVRVQDARFQQSLVDYDNTVLRAAQEVEDGLVGLLKAREAAVSATNAAAAAQRSVDLSFLQYREGAVDFQRVIDAQRSLLQEQNTLALTRSSVATNLIALYKALGGGWEMRLGQPVVSDSTRIEMQNRTNWGDAFSKPTQHSSTP